MLKTKSKKFCSLQKRGHKLAAPESERAFFSVLHIPKCENTCKKKFYILMIYRIFSFLFFKYVLLIMLLQLSHFFLSFIPLYPLTHHYSPHLSSCPWVIHISSLASPVPIIFFTSPSILYYHLYFLFPVPYPSFSPYTTSCNPPCDLYFCESVTVLVVCLVHFCFCFFRFS